jgi:hypothetical protein
VIDVITKEWVFDAAQTNAKLQDVAANERMAVTYIQCTCANSNSADVAVRVGFGAATLPTVTNNSLTGNAGMLLSHGGIARGGGAIAANGGAVLATGQADEDLRITSTVPTGGFLHVIVAYEIKIAVPVEG